MLILADHGTVVQGANLSRIQAKAGLNSVKLKLYTMKEMNESLGNENSISNDKNQEISVLETKVKELPIADEHMVLINLISRRAATVIPEYFGRIIPSNFAIIRVNKTLYAPYLEWYLNEHPESKKYLSEATQGTTVRALSIQKLRTVPILLPTLEEQKLIGDVYKSILNKKRLLLQRINLEEKIINQQLFSYLQEGSI